MPSDPNTQLAISKIDRAIYLLVNSFGHRSEVVQHLKAARAMLGERETAVEIVTDLSTSTEVGVVAEEAATPAPKRKKAEPRPQTRKRMGRSK